GRCSGGASATSGSSLLGSTVGSVQESRTRSAPIVTRTPPGRQREEGDPCHGERRGEDGGGLGEVGGEGDEDGEDGGGCQDGEVAAPGHGEGGERGVAAGGDVGGPPGEVVEEVGLGGDEQGGQEVGGVEGGGVEVPQEQGGQDDDGASGGGGGAEDEEGG